MAPYHKHRRFTLRCFKADIYPVSYKIKNPIKTPKSYQILHRAEKKLLHERVGTSIIT